MSDLTCDHCGEDFENEATFGEDVQCPYCKTWLTTDWDEDYSDGEVYMYSWVTGTAKRQDR